MLKQSFLASLKKIIPYISLTFILINFLFFEDFFYRDSFSSRLFATEAGILLFYCLEYYLFRLHAEVSKDDKQPEFWVITGLSIYVVFNFPYFLLYTTLLPKHIDFVENMWDYHNITFIILCLFIAKAFTTRRIQETAASPPT